MKRASGILLPVFSLPGEYGIGTLSNHAKKFIDQLERAGQSYWQILPIGPTGYGDSPYQPVSTYAGNPYLVDLVQLADEGLLNRDELDSINWGTNPSYVDYGKMWENKERVLRIAYDNFLQTASPEKKQQYELQRDNLKDETKKYCLYQAIKKDQEYKAWDEWEEDIRTCKPEAISSAKEKLSDDVGFREWIQVQFMSQWMAIKEYAHEHRIQIIGDIPIYASQDSSDAWSEPQLFQFDEHSKPTAVAGCPPDYFSPEGQLWGNPLYKWSYHKETGYEWWMHRMDYALTLYDYVRIDHFRGFDEYYAVPAGEETAKNGKWEHGPGMEIFEHMKEYFADRYTTLPIIAEDLGMLTDSVRALLRDSGFPGMKVLEFAYDSDSENLYLPHNYQRNCIAYTGTHDNDPLCGWLDKLQDHIRDRMKFYQGSEYTPDDKLNRECIRTVMGSVADTVIIPIQDYLGTGSETRLNEPGTAGSNWQWRMQEGQLDDELIAYCNKLSKMYSRYN